MPRKLRSQCPILGGVTGLSKDRTTPRRAQATNGNPVVSHPEDGWTSCIMTALPGTAKEKWAGQKEAGLKRVCRRPWQGRGKTGGRRAAVQRSRSRG